MALGWGRGPVPNQPDGWPEWCQWRLGGEFDFGLGRFGCWLVILIAVYSRWLFFPSPYLDTPYRIDGQHHLLSGVGVGTGIVSHRVKSRVAQRYACASTFRFIIGANQRIRVTNVGSRRIERRCGRHDLVGEAVGPDDPIGT